MAPRLRADDRPLILTPRRWGHTFDANLIDVIVEHDIHVCDPPPHARIDLLEWLQSGSDGGVRRSLEHMAADRRYQPLLSAAVPSFCDYAERSVDDLLVSPGLEQLLRRWFQERASAVDRGGLIQAARSLSELAGAAGPRTLGRFPTAYAALARARLAPSLARTLQGGLIDELGWPALEDAVTELQATGPSLGSSASWPVLVVHSATRAIAVGLGGRVAEHDLRLTNPSPHQQPWVLYAGGQFLVSWRDRQSGRQVAYWSGTPNEVFPLAEPRFGRGSPFHGFSLLLPDGGRTSGGRALYPGDRELSGDASHVLWDGDTLWAVDWDREQYVLRELDPHTGERGRHSLPSFLEGRADSGERLLVELCSLAPLPAGLEGTPLGQSGGAVGFRVATVQRGSGPVVRVEGIDGRRLEVLPGVPAQPLALVDLPGATRPRLLAGFPPLAHRSGCRRPSGTVSTPATTKARAPCDGSTRKPRRSCSTLPWRTWTAPRPSGWTRCPGRRRRSSACCLRCPTLGSCSACSGQSPPPCSSSGGASSSAATPWRPSAAGRCGRRRRRRRPTGCRWTSRRCSPPSPTLAAAAAIPPARRGSRSAI